MKFIKYVLLFFAAVLFFPKNTFALSCASTSPKIGIIEKVTPTENHELELRNTQSFRTDVRKDNFYLIDEYKNVVKRYLKGEQLQKSSEEIHRLNLAYIPRITLEKIDIQENDIFIQGLPFHVCSYRFSGFFSPDGELKYAIVNDNFMNYLYDDTEITISSGKKLECDDKYCSVRVNYTVGDEKFTLSPGQSYSLLNDTIKSITLLESSDYNSGMSEAYDWGSGLYVTYIIDFLEDEKNIDCIKNLSEECENTEGEQLNFFNKLFDWLKLIFQIA